MGDAITRTWGRAPQKPFPCKPPLLVSWDDKRRGLVSRAQRKVFEGGEWGSDAEIQAFAQEAATSGPLEVSKLLEVLTDEKFVRDTRGHRQRCKAFGVIVRLAPAREYFVPLLEALRSGDDNVRALTVELLPLVNRVDGHSALCQLLGEPDAAVRAAIAKVLGEVGGAQALQTLTQLVGKKDFQGRTETMDAMVPKARHHAVEMLRTVLTVGNPMERARALRWLGRQDVFEKDTTRVTEIVVKYMEDPHERVLAQAVQTLSVLVNERAFFKHAGHLAEAPNPTLRRAFILGLRIYNTPRVMGYLGKVLRTEADALCITAIEVLEESTSADALPLLVETLGDKRVVVRDRSRQGLAKLAKLGRIDLARAVIWLLKNRDITVRRMAAELTRELGQSTIEIVPKLLRFLRDEDWWVRERVMDTLVEQAGRQLTVHVAEYLKDPSPVVRRYSVGALRRILDPASLGALVRVAMEDTDWWCREQAIETIAEIKDPRATPYLMKILFKDADTRLVTIEALRVLGAKDAAPFVAEALKSDNPPVRMAALQFLSHFDERAFAGNVAPLVNDPEKAVRRTAEELLARWNLGDRSVTKAEALSRLEQLLLKVAELGADDLVVAVGQLPFVKRLGRMEPIGEEPLREAELQAMIHATLDQERIAELNELREVDYSHQLKSHGLRFRGNVFRQLTGLSAVYRIIRSSAVEFESLGLPPIVQTFADLPNGLVLVGGPTGSGKSTTLAALIHHINVTRACHVVTIEDPIETVHACHKSLLNQREVGTDTPDFLTALRSVLRQDPDVILVGEMRDFETISFAVAAAETGHLVFGTVHTASADKAVDRLLNVFPPGQRPKIRSMLSESLKAVVCQHLCRRKDTEGRRVLAAEVMINDDSIANLIRKDQSFKIPSVMMTRREKGMLLMEHSLADLLTKGLIGRDEALMRANDPKQLEALLEPSKNPDGTPVKPGPPAQSPPQTAAAPSPAQPMRRPDARDGR